MQFLITAYDGKNKLEKRMEVRPRHIDNMARINGKVICAGGLLDEAGQMIGSALVMEFSDRELLDQYLAEEPYVVEGVWEKIDVLPMNVVLLDGRKVGK